MCPKTKVSRGHSVSLCYQRFEFWAFFPSGQVKLPDELSEPFKQIKLQLEYLQKVAQDKQNELSELRLAFDSNLQSYNQLIEKHKNKVQQLKKMIALQVELAGNRTIAQEDDDSTLQKLKMEINELMLHNNLNFKSSASELDIQLPDFYKMLPHLKNAPNQVQPLYKQSNSRQATIAIGVPTIKRPKTSYLLETIKSLIYSMNDFEQTDALIVIMIGEVCQFGSETLEEFEMFDWNV